MKQKLKFLTLKLIAKIRKMILGPFSVGVIYSTENGLIAAPIEDVTIGRHLGFNGSWDISEISELLGHVAITDTIYVLGTHVGTLLIPISKKCKKIIGYEANPDTFRYITFNVHANNIQNVSLFNYAVGDSTKKMKFYMNKINSGGSKIKPIKDSFIYNYDKPKTIEVDMLSLDEHIETENLPNPDCIIIDIEGAEYIALKGMQNALKNTTLLYIEYVPHHLKNVSNVDNQLFINLIAPYFDLVKFVRKKKEINIEESSTSLIQYLDKLYINNISDDMLFIKTPKKN